MAKKGRGKEVTGIDALVRDYEREPVPEMRQKSWYNMGLVWGGVAACLACLMVGGLVGSMLTLTAAAIAVVCGSLITTVIGAIASTVGGRLNLSTPMISRFAFGDWGVYIVALVLAFGSYGWFAVQLGLFGETFKASYGIMTGITPGMIGLWLAIIIGGILMTASAVFGYRALAWLSLIAVVPIVLLMIASLVLVLGQYSWGELLAHPPANPAPLAVVISLVAGGFMVGAVITPDVSRYAKSAGHSVGGVLLGFFAFQAVIMYIGVILSHAVGEWDIVKIMLGLGWGLVAMLVLVLAQWTTNDNNLYSAALSFSVVFRRWPKWWLTAAAGVIGIILALWGIYGRFPEWLMFLGVLIPPIAGAYIADYYLVNRDFYKFENLPKVAKARWLMLASWVVASFIGFCTTFPPTGFGWFNITTIPAIDTFLIGFVLALILGWSYKKVKGGWPEATPA
ncbi:MAG: cytosine permease [Dehalococcoidia bacterium]|nr:cytosine permease [Dehalococcoidia bacterium]